jgi:hypothetical protein
MGCNPYPVGQNDQEGVKPLFEVVSTDDGEDDTYDSAHEDEEHTVYSLSQRSEHQEGEGKA